MFSREVGRLNKTESSISSSDEYDMLLYALTRVWSSRKCSTLDQRDGGSSSLLGAGKEEKIGASRSSLKREIEVPGKWEERTPSKYQTGF